MRVEFNQGVPTGCIDWLWKNIGPGNLKPVPTVSIPGFMMDTQDSVEFNWFYERVFIPKPNSPQNEGRNVPTITVKDSKLATLFMLKWS